MADGSPAPATDPNQFVPTTRPGTRAPHAWLEDGRSTLDLFGDGFVLLSLGAGPSDPARLLCAAGATGVPMRAVAIADAEVAALYETRLVLVRPDGHVAWRGDDVPADPAALVQHVRGAAGERPVMPQQHAEARTMRTHLL